MAANDMEVIIYKILRYMYECSKAGKSPCNDDLQHKCKMFSIPVGYYNDIIEEIIRNGWVKGISYFVHKDGKYYDMSEAKITYEGVCFLRDNSGMKKAKEVVGAVFEPLLSAIINAITM